MRQILRKFEGEGRKAVALGIALALAGCGGGSGGRGGAGSTFAPITSGTSPLTSGTVPGVQASQLTALDISPAGDIEIYGFAAAGVGQTAGNAEQQIIVDGFFKDGSQKDLTRVVSYKVADEAVAKVSGDGIVTPVSEGATTITVALAGAGGQTLTVTRNIKVSSKPVGTVPAALELWPGLRKLSAIDPVAGKDEFQQFVVVVKYTDGTREDLTRKIGLQITDAQTGGPTVAGKASATGLFRGVDNATLNVVADASALGMVATAKMILGTGGQGGSGNGFTPYSGFPLTGSTNVFDVVALAALKAQAIEPAKLADDGEFLRRVTADLVGRLPSEAELIAFKADTSATKRAAKIDALLASPEFAAHWAKDVVGPWLCVSGAAFDTALQAEIAADRPLADVVKNLATSTGALAAPFDAKFNMAYLKVDQLVNTFTGMTSKCARCHDHPLTTAMDDPRWVQDENYGLYAYFAASPADATKLNKAGQRFGQPVEPSWVFDKTVTGLPKLADPIATRKAKFADLFVQTNAFYRGTGHRIWSELMTPLLDPNEFLKSNLNAVTNPKLLDVIGQAFKDQATSLKGFVRTVCNSRVYQLTTKGTSTKNDDLLARRTVRRHHAEVLEQGVSQIAGVPFASSTFFEQNFGYPSARTTIKERNDSVNMIQAFTLMNSTAATNGKIVMAGSQIAKLAADVTAKTITLEAAITTIFRAGLSRDPSATELAAFVKECQAAHKYVTGI